MFFWTVCVAQDRLLKEARVEITTSFGAVHQFAAWVLAENVYSGLEQLKWWAKLELDIFRSLALENIKGVVLSAATWKQSGSLNTPSANGWERGITGFG